MLLYAGKRILLMIPTLLGIMVINFIVIQAAPGGPIEQTLSKIRGGAGSMDRVSGSGQENLARGGSAQGGLYRGARGLDPAFIKQLEKQYGFDKPPVERFLDMMRHYLTFDFGNSFFRSQRVVDLVLDKLPVSISLGLWSTLLTYLISIPLGVAKAVRHGSRFDVWSSSVVIVAYAVPGFLFGILLIVLFSGGSFLNLFPLRGLTSDDWASFSLAHKVVDYLWHITLPVLALTIGGFASLTMLTKNSFLDEIGKQYVTTARAKGLTERRILYGHVFRNAMLLVVAGFPAAFVGILFTSSLLIEVIFSLDGLGLLGFEAALNRDYPIMFGSLYVFTLIGLVLNLAGDLLYTAVDPRIDFAARRS